MSPRAFDIGWRPASDRSIIERRRCPNAQQTRRPGRQDRDEPGRRSSAPIETQMIRRFLKLSRLSRTYVLKIEDRGSKIEDRLRRNDTVLDLLSSILDQRHSE